MIIKLLQISLLLPKSQTKHDWIFGLSLVLSLYDLSRVSSYNCNCKLVIAVKVLDALLKLIIFLC